MNLDIIFFSVKSVLHVPAAQQSVHPTLGIRRHFQAFSYASAFFQSDGVPPPAPARVTQTVGCKVKRKTNANARAKTNQVLHLFLSFSESLFFSGGFLNIFLPFLLCLVWFSIEFGYVFVIAHCVGFYVCESWLLFRAGG